MRLPNFRRPRLLIVIAAVLTLTAAPTGWYLANQPPVIPPVAFSEFLQNVDGGRVTQVTFHERTITAQLKDTSRITTVAPPEFLSANGTFVTDLVRQNIRVDVAPAEDPGAVSYGAIATAMAFFGLLCFTVYRTTAGRIPSMGARARVAERGEHVVTFQDVAGVDEAKDEV